MRSISNFKYVIAKLKRMYCKNFTLGVMQLLRPLLLDIVPTVQQTAALALGKLANHNDDLAEAVVKGDILPQLVYSLAEQNVTLYVYLDVFGIITIIL